MLAVERLARGFVTSAASSTAQMRLGFGQCNGETLKTARSIKGFVVLCG
jgi:hypothetical protein